MHNQYTFAINAINAGRTVLVYNWPSQGKVAHVAKTERLALRGGVMYVDGKSAKGKTICLKP